MVVVVVVVAVLGALVVIVGFLPGSGRVVRVSNDVHSSLDYKTVSKSNGGVVGAVVAAAPLDGANDKIINQNKRNIS